MAIPAIIARAANSKAVEGTLNTFGMRSVPLLAGIFDAAKRSGAGKLSPKPGGESAPSKVGAIVKTLGALAKNRVQSTAMSGIAGMSRDMSSRLNAMAKAQTGTSRSILKFGAAVTRLGSMQASRKARELRSGPQVPTKNAPKKSNQDKAEDDEKANRERQEKAAKAGQGDGELDVLKVISRDTKDIKEGIETLVKDGLKAKEEKKEEGGGLLGAIGSLLSTVVGRRLGLIAAGIAGTVGRFLSRGVASLGRLGAGLLKRPLAAASRGIASIAGRAGVVGRGLLARGGMMAAGGAIVSKASTIGRAALTKGAAAANAVRGTAGRLIGKFSPNAVDDVAKQPAAKPKAGKPQYSRGPQRGKAARAAKARAAVRRAAARKAAAGAGVSVAGKAAATGVAGKAAAKGVGKAVGKSVLKKIPIIGAGVGLGLAAHRAWGGDWTGAGMEAASGLAGTLPGVGTAASIGIDAALMARDMQGETQGAGAVVAKPKDPTSNDAAKMAKYRAVKQYLDNGGTDPQTFSRVYDQKLAERNAPKPVPPALKPAPLNAGGHSSISSSERHLESIDRTLKDMLDNMTSNLKGIYTKPIDSVSLFEQQKQHAQQQNKAHTQQQRSYGEGRPEQSQQYYDPRVDYSRTGQPSLNARDPSKPDFSDVWGSSRTTEGLIQKYEPKESSLQPAPAFKQSSFLDAQDQALLSEIQKGESGKQGYDAVIGQDRVFKQMFGDRKLTDLTFDELNGWRKATLNDQRARGIKQASSAIGKYQVVGSNIWGQNGNGGLMKKLGIRGDQKFTPEIQDRLAMALIDERGDWTKYKRGELTQAQLRDRVLAPQFESQGDSNGRIATRGSRRLGARASHMANLDYVDSLKGVSTSTALSAASIPPALRATRPAETTATIARESVVATAQKKAAPVVVMNPTPAPQTAGATVSRGGGGSTNIPPVIVRAYDAPIKNYSNMLVSIV